MASMTLASSMGSGAGCGENRHTGWVNRLFTRRKAAGGTPGRSQCGIVLPTQIFQTVVEIN